MAVRAGIRAQKGWLRPEQCYLWGERGASESCVGWWVYPQERLRKSSPLIPGLKSSPTPVKHTSLKPSSTRVNRDWRGLNHGELSGYSEQLSTQSAWPRVREDPSSRDLALLGGLLGPLPPTLHTQL